jgi:hypothetical protein
MGRTKWSSVFNAIINTYELREFNMSGGQFTWSNNHANPTLEKLDRFLMNSEWENLFPVTVHKISRDIYDHNPIILDTLEDKEHRSISFRFEKSWLKEEDFLSRVERIWREHVNTRNSLELVQIKLKKVKKILERLGSKY